LDRSKSRSWLPVGGKRPTGKENEAWHWQLGTRNWQLETGNQKDNWQLETDN
jgi:hypothetical protein